MKDITYGHFVSDSWNLFRRNVKHLLRNPESLFVSIFLPVILMLLFVYVFGGAIHTGTEYVNYIVPGIIITCVGYASSMTAISVTQDMVGGMFDRLRSMPVHSSSLLIGHVAGSFIRNSISTILVIAVAFLTGFEANAGLLEWLAAIGILGLFLLAISWLSVVFGLLANTVETASSFTFIVMFLPYISSAFVPTDTMPTWLQAFAANQPMTPLIEAVRGYLIGTPNTNEVWLTLIWFGSLLIISFFLATAIYKRKSRT
ncbi:ABC transporter permease [Sutcliffiella rhizosphaerae]|uniref:Transport permease protein n=1 Tax=Sutcliffiella rhizosphaerae TaxID=2880967 RepID=A0ABN8AH06_9BACI|nr:ABC transporter permease [Sutcliffiella rhizosphaerae]CAG9622428.1 Daunorubicin/doxorubicin resistance ABC transporter permease protein DrrB [Sutcliffiella rhizosphaerae]